MQKLYVLLSLLSFTSMYISWNTSKEKISIFLKIIQRLPNYDKFFLHVYLDLCWESFVYSCSLTQLSPLMLFHLSFLFCSSSFLISLYGGVLSFVHLYLWTLFSFLFIHSLIVFFLPFLSRSAMIHDLLFYLDWRSIGVF